MSSFARNAVVLGLLSAVGPFAIDMYLPALPSISGDLHASTAATQLSLTVYFLAFGVFQIIYGPASDMIGRRPPLAIGLALFALGALGGALAPSIGWLIAARVLQGIGAAAVTVIPRAIIRDLHTGAEATRLMAMVMLVFGVSPLLAPLFGAALIALVGWRAVFVAMSIAAVLGLILVGLLLPETRPIALRSKAGLAPVLSSFAHLLRDRQFIGLVLIGGFGMASFFSYLAGSSFIYIGHFNLTPTQYSLAFALNAAGFIGASQLAAPLGVRLGMRRAVIGAVALYASFALLLLALTLSGVDQLAVLMALLFAIFGCLGVALPQTMVMSLEQHGPIAGAASALSATLQMLIGAALIALISLFENGTALPMVAGIATAACAALGVTLATLRRPEPLPQPAE
ncbi:MAG TPA: multidrug effflux MFS transporter [Rhodopseudomonas sp.]|uniref:multidrug effflux MFS transporter n=1 Tax=Rhodopseudomonas sp. TaxID=1078 RepID=UPI002EDAC531